MLKNRSRLAIVEYKSKRMSGRLSHWIPSQIGSVRPGRCVRSSGSGIFLKKIHILGQIQNYSIFTNYCLVFFVLPNQFVQ